MQVRYSQLTKLLPPAATAMALTLMLSSTAQAESGYYNNFQNRYPGSATGPNVVNGVGSSCVLCHGPASINHFNGYGWELRNLMNGGMNINQALAAAEPPDSDLDPTGSSNLLEINSDTQPGWTDGPHNTIFVKGGSPMLNQDPPSGILGSLDPAQGPGVAFGGGAAGFPCPCNNNNDGTLLPDLSGCASTPNPEGARLLGSGIASVSSDTVVLEADHVKNNAWGLFFKGNTQLLPGVPMGGANANGLLQCATKIKRFGPVQADGTGYADSSSYASDLHTLSNAVAGDTRHYQWWYRTPKKSGPCSNPSSGGSNTSNGYSITWTP